MQHQSDARDVSRSDAAAAIQATFGPLVSTCARFGIGRTIAFKLAREGAIDTFRIGARTFVQIASLVGLSQRLAAQAKRRA